MYRDAHTRTHGVHIHVYIYIYICVYVYAYIYICIYIHIAYIRILEGYVKRTHVMGSV